MILVVALAVLLVIFSVVLVHELGHFVVAKLSGIRVDEFSVGFGPKLASRRRGETEYSLRLIPAGGYVRMAGMLGLAGEADAGDRNFYRASIPKRLLTIVAGVVMNFLFAAAILTVDATVPIATTVQTGAAAQGAGMQNGDVILTVDGHAIRHDTKQLVATDLHAATAASQGRPMTVVISRGGARRTLLITPSLVVTNSTTPATTSTGAAPPLTSVADIPPQDELVVTAIHGAAVGTGDPAVVVNAGGTLSGFLLNVNDGSRGATVTNLAAGGVSDADAPTTPINAGWRMGVTPNVDGKSVTQALGDGFGAIPAFIHDTYSGIAGIIGNPKSGGLNGPQGLSGPVGIVRATATVTQQGGRSLIEWIAFISLNLGLINLLPIPFLDGGKAMFIVLEAVRRKRLNPQREALIYAVGLALVVVFAIYVTIGDVSRSQ